MIRDADDLKERIGRAAYVWSGVAQPARRRLRAPRSRSTAPSGTTAGRPASCSATSATLFGGVEVFPDARAGRRPARARRRHGRGRSCSGRGRSPAPPSATRPVAVRARHEGDARSRSSSTARSATSSTAATAARSSRSRSRSSRARCSVCVPRRGRGGEADGRIHATRRGCRCARRRRKGEDVARTPQFEWLARAGLVARGVVYAIIGVLAIKLALGDGGKTTEPAGRAADDRAGSRSGKVAARPGRGRPRGLRPLAARARRDRPRPGGERRHQGAHRRPRQRHRLRDRSASRPSRSSSARAAAAARASPDKATGGVLGWPAGPGARGDRRARSSSASASSRATRASRRSSSRSRRRSR